MTVSVNACLRTMSSRRSKTEKSDVKLSQTLSQTTRRLRANVYKDWCHTGVLVRRPLCAKRWENEKLARKRSSILAHLRSLNRFGWPSTCRSLCETHSHWQSSSWVYRSPRSPKIRNGEDSSYVSSPFNHAFKEPKIQVRADPLRGSNNQVPRAMEKMTELVWCINLYQWCYLCANTVHFETISNKVCRRKGTWKNRLLFQAHSKLL